MEGNLFPLVKPLLSLGEDASGRKVMEKCKKPRRFLQGKSQETYKVLAS
jgi:hypothetical protein